MNAFWSNACSALKKIPDPTWLPVHPGMIGNFSVYSKILAQRSLCNTYCNSIWLNSFSSLVNFAWKICFDFKSNTEIGRRIYANYFRLNFKGLSLCFDTYWHTSCMQPRFWEKVIFYPCFAAFTLSAPPRFVTTWGSVKFCRGYF